MENYERRRPNNTGEDAPTATERDGGILGEADSSCSFTPVCGPTINTVEEKHKVFFIGTADSWEFNRGYLIIFCLINRLSFQR